VSATRFRSWVSANGVTHLVPPNGPCATCGGAHPSLTELASAAKAVEMAHKLADAVGLGRWEDAYAAADWLRDEAALLRAAAKDHGGADWLQEERAAWAGHCPACTPACTMAGRCHEIRGQLGVAPGTERESDEG